MRMSNENSSSWTAIHELSDLMHPYLGDCGNRPSEGFGEDVIFDANASDAAIHVAITPML